tara:strand:- start:4676 stop:6208 length:1533 start_codon:yes stop_codon:yes gene_type:complete
MDIKKLVRTLSPLERRILPFLKDFSNYDDIIEASGMKDVEVMRALQWLSNKKILKIDEQVKELVDLDKNGVLYFKQGLPEKRFLLAIKDGHLSTLGLMKKAELSKEEFNVCIGLLRKKVAIDIQKSDKALMIKILDNGKKIIQKQSLEEQFLNNKFPIEIKSLKPEEKFAFTELKKRKNIIKTETKKIKTIHLTDTGKKLSKLRLNKDVIERLTTEVIKTGSWKKKEFREYDVEINVPKIDGGKRHFVKQSIEYAKGIWKDLGFKEMDGPLLNTSFWNFDALFTAQDHPVRDLQDTFYIKDPKKGSLPSKKLVADVKKVHEKGTKGSTGWKYKWDPEEAKKNVMRTHTTVLSSKTIANLKKEDLPAKFFAIGRCFRNEAVDWCHLFEFNQTEGIVIDPNANFRNLLGYLKQFFKKMGYPKARFRPAHFPYTEPSVEVDVYHPVHKKWIELGGAGMFRPEVVEPLLGFPCPVLAWGPGFDRIMMEFYKLKDLRDLYKNDLKQLRNMKMWMK